MFGSVKHLFPLSFASLHVFLEALSLGNDKARITRVNRFGVLGVGLSSKRPSLLNSLSGILGRWVGVNNLSEDSGDSAESRSGGKCRGRCNKGSNNDGTL